jgi:RNA polymerase sigma-70 factor (ECF subfamily)
MAYRMLGSPSEAEDAVQEAWLRLNSVDAATIENLGGCLTTVVSRVCLDMLRSRGARREEPIGLQVTEARTALTAGAHPESETLLADSVGVALLVVLDTLTLAERLVFVLHDLFGVPFDEIGSIVGRSPGAAKQLASRARRRVRGSSAPSDLSRARQRGVIKAFLRAAREGALEGLMAVLAPDAVIRIDGAARIAGGSADAADVPRELRGASTWAKQLIAMSRGSRLGHLGAHQWIGWIDPRAGRQAVQSTDLHLHGRQDPQIEVIGDRLAFVRSISPCSELRVGTGAK